MNDQPVSNRPRRRHDIRRAHRWRRQCERWLGRALRECIDPHSELVRLAKEHRRPEV